MRNWRALETPDCGAGKWISTRWPVVVSGEILMSSTAFSLSESPMAAFNSGSVFSGSDAATSGRWIGGLPSSSGSSLTSFGQTSTSSSAGVLLSAGMMGSPWRWVSMTRLPVFKANPANCSSMPQAFSRSVRPTRMRTAGPGFSPVRVTDFTGAAWDVMQARRPSRMALDAVAGRAEFFIGVRRCLNPFWRRCGKTGGVVR